MPPTQIERALRELHVVWIPAHSPQAKGRVERQFLTAQDRLVKGLRVAGACTIEQANAYLEKEYLPWWNKTLVVPPADAADAHRPLGKEHDLVAILSHVEPRQVTNDYTCGTTERSIKSTAGTFRLECAKPGARGGAIGRDHRRAVPRSLCARAPLRSARTASVQRRITPPRPTGKRQRKSDWMKNFSFRSGPSLRHRLEVANARS